MPKNKHKFGGADGKGKKFVPPLNKGRAVGKPLPFISKPVVTKPIVLPPDAPALGVPKDAKPTKKKKWCLKNTQVFHAVIEKWVAKDLSKTLLSSIAVGSHPINKHKVVVLLKQDISTVWSAVSFESIAFELIDPIKRTRDWVTTRVTGWVQNAYLDDFVSDYPDFEVDIPHATPLSTDPHQYMTLEIDDEEKKFKDKVQTNMCGELSVAYVTEKDIDTVLTAWKAKPGSSFNSILGMGKNFTTGPRHIKEILDIYFPDPNSVEPYLTATQTIPPVINRIPLAAPGALHRASDEFRAKLKTHDFIALLRIDTFTGGLKRTFNPGDRNHWIVVTQTMRNGLRVELYNPFPNRRQVYSFGEFNASVGSNPQSGWWVKRKKSSVERSFRQPDFGVAANHPTSSTIDAEQYVFLEGGGVQPKNNLCGQFSTAFIISTSMSTSLENWKTRQKSQPAGLWELTNMLDSYGFNNADGKRTFSIDTLLHYWKKIQPNLHAATVGGDTDEGTDISDLMSILRAYGYRKEDMSLTRPIDPAEPFLFSPAREAKILKDYYLIVGVIISGSTGRLKDKNDGGVKHWVVINSIDPDGNQFGGGGGWVELYNSFPNCWEEYSLGEFSRAFNGGTLWVKREITPVFRFETPAPPKVKIKPNMAARPGKGGKGKGKGGTVFGVVEIQKEFKRLMSQPHAVLGKIIQRLVSLSGMNRTQITKLVVAGGDSGKPAVEIDKLLCAHFGVQSVPEAMSRWIDEKARDDETHALQLADTLHRFGFLLVKEKKCSMANLEKFDLAGKVKSAVGKPPATLASGGGDRRALLLQAGEQITFDASALAAKPFVSNAIQELKVIVAKIAEEQTKNKITRRPKPKHAIKPREKYLKWIRRIEKADPDRLYRVRIWGDPEMMKLGFDVNDPHVPEDAVKGVGHFQAVGLYNNLNKEFGAISNHIDIQRDDIDNLIQMQIEEKFDGKLITRKQKMNWLCAFRGKIFMYDDDSHTWEKASQIRWGTIALGGNLVQIERFETIEAKLPGENKRRVHRMGRLVGFRKEDWARPLDELLAEGLVHRCFCVYKKNGFGDVPNKGIAFSPLFSPEDWGFNGKKKLDALYIPEVYLEPKRKK